MSVAVGVAYPLDGVLGSVLLAAAKAGRASLEDIIIDAEPALDGHQRCSKVAVIVCLVGSK